MTPPLIFPDLLTPHPFLCPLVPLPHLLFTATPFGTRHVTTPPHSLSLSLLSRSFPPPCISLSPDHVMPRPLNSSSPSFLPPSVHLSSLLPLSPPPLLSLPPLLIIPRLLPRQTPPSQLVTLRSYSPFCLPFIPHPKSMYEP
ncbi:hypothetical protein Pmani_010727 [Petrolisthes manimaculis]|uniref:Uncharacterized protein n=1 Tax=Petrolisthes manimaculis TaxID=1843537 RepID=A0AAE1UGE9_9EUCA|nr:hypothetical protein Pmani_010727 [Petrolisthes manimaculis]